MHSIVTVTGPDHTGIIAGVTTTLAAHDVNVVDSSQTIMDTWFTMILRVEIPDDSPGIAALEDVLAAPGREQNVSIRVQAEELFSAVNDL